LPGFDPLLQAQSGMMAGQGGGLGEEPIYHTIPVNDVASAAVSAFGVIAALNARERTGVGQDVQTSLAAQSVHYQSGEMVEYAGRPATDNGAPDCLGVRALHRYYECRDGWLAVVCTTPDEARALAGILEIDIDPAEALAAPRDGALAQALAEAFAGRARSDVLNAALAAGVPLVPAIRGVEAYESEWLWENGFFQEWSYEPAGDLVGIRGYADFTRSLSGFTRSCPMLGEHSVEVLRDFGISEARIGELLASRAVLSSG
jgi:crotonobetainyl-CoA:carnitine CoA-transferase CaiB-like acyl-CoA transferase